jgi:hypothetical protein
VIKNSPSEAAGIIPGEDFLLGTSRFYYKEYEEFQREFKRILKLARSSQKTLKIPLAFFNVKQKNVRTVVLNISPLEEQGGRIGLEFSLGLLHNLVHIANYKNLTPNEI